MAAPDARFVPAAAPFAVIMFTPAAHTEADRLVEPLRGGIGLVDLQDALVVQRLAEHV